MESSPCTFVDSDPVIAGRRRMGGAGSSPRDELTQRRVLAGRVAIVTGANGGLGKATAEGLAAAGATVILACRRPEAAEAAAAEIRARVPQVNIHGTDLSRLNTAAWPCPRPQAGVGSGPPLELWPLDQSGSPLTFWRPFTND